MKLNLKGILTFLYFTHDPDRTHVLVSAFAPEPDEQLIPIRMSLSVYNPPARKPPRVEAESRNPGMQTRQKNFNRAEIDAAKSLAEKQALCKQLLTGKSSAARREKAAKGKKGGGGGRRKSSHSKAKE
jgi:hypothetical protein